MKTLCGWYSESDHRSPGLQQLWLHPELRYETVSAAHGPDTAAASVQHLEETGQIRFVKLIELAVAIDTSITS